MEVERIRERAERGDPTWPAQLAVATAIVLNLVLTEQVTIGPPWLLPVLEGVLLVALFRLAPSRLDAQHPGRRRLSLGLTGLISLADVVSLALLVHYLVAGGHANGHRLIASGAALWATNVLLFAVWFWEMDGGGPVVASPARTSSRTSSSRRWRTRRWRLQAGGPASGTTSTCR
jgi:hypothetical protein